MQSVTRVLRDWGARQDKAVIFDFNGTLSDDEPLLLRIFTEIFAEYLGWRLTPEDYLSRLAGLSDREIVERVAHEQGGDRDGLVGLMLWQRRHRYRELVADESPVRAETRALVERLAAAGVPMGVVTGAQREDVDLVLRHSDLQTHLPVMVTVEDVEKGKPHPEGFLAGAQALGVDPAAVLVFEDSVAGAEGARAAGMRVIGVEGGGATAGELAKVADAVVPALDPSLLDDLFASSGS